MADGAGAPLSDSAATGPNAESPRPPSPRSLGRVLAAIAVVAVVVVAGILGALFVTGLGPFHRSGPPPGPVTFAAARAAGDSAVAGFGAGAWDLVGAASALVRQSVSVPIPTVDGSLRPYLGGCGLHWLGSGAALSVPSFSGDAGAGIAPIWELVYRNGSPGGSGLLFVSVLNGSAQLTASLPSTGACATPAALSSALVALPTSIVDSPKVIAAADGAGGSAFLAAHPTATVTMALNGEFHLFTLVTPSVWTVAYSLCAFPPTATSIEPEFNATVDPTTGLVGSAQTVSENCTTLAPANTGRTAPIPLNESLSWSMATTAASGGGHWANASVATASHGIRFGNLSISVNPASGTLRPSASWSLWADSVSGSHLAEYNLTTGRCMSGADVPISATDALTLFSASTSLSMGSFFVVGSGEVQGFEQIVIP
ncbi:MAG TPA: hypothetical protein VGX00_04030 [Thermoplasmata archaeon]|nr:hypothetical protein [Thermoplasmata archaeon]